MTTAEYHRRYYRERRRQPMIDYLGGKCVDCGTTNDLQFDHDDPATKLFDIKANMTLNNPKVRSELDKCVLRCRQHHREKTSRERAGNEDGFTHGSVYGWMKKKCECETCATAKRAWHDERNAKRRKPRQKEKSCSTGHDVRTSGS